MLGDLVYPSSTFKEKMREMFIQNNERPSCDPVDVQLMSETTERPMHDFRKLQIMAAFGIHFAVN